MEELVKTLFERYSALLEGHFQLSSGLHSDRYVQCALVLQHPEVASLLGNLLAGLFQGEEVDVVVGPALGGIVVAHEAARFLRARALFTERVAGAMQLRRGFAIMPGEKVLVVEDVVTTGGSTREVLEVVRACGGVPVGVGALVVRSLTPPDFGVPFRSLIKLALATYPPEDCPLCRAGIPLEKPGSRPGPGVRE